MNGVPQALPQVLIFTDDIDFYLQLKHILNDEGCGSYLVGSADEFSLRSSEQKTDVVILDNRLSDAFASAAGALIRSDENTKAAPIIVLTRNQAKIAPVEPFATESAETVASPIMPETLIERVKFCLSVSGSIKQNPEEPIGEVKYADVEMNLTTYRVKRGDRDIHLSPIEFKLLRHFLERPEQAVSRDELKTAIWEDRIHVEYRTVDVHVGRLRRALAGQTQKNLIRTIRSVGYALSD